MEHLSHPHPLILKDVLHFEDGDHCHGCGERLLCKSSSVYTCSTISNIDHTSRLSAENEFKKTSCASFFLHKKCAHLPPTCRHQGCNLELNYVETPFSSNISCEMCLTKIRYLFYRSFNRDPVEEAYEYSREFILCLKCAMHNNKNNSEDDDSGSVDHQTIIKHWSHQHSVLRFVDRYATFYCDACNNVSTDFSYMCADERCPFWIHQSCAHLPKLCTYVHLHKHPLTLASSLPEEYQNFTHFCKICKKLLHPSLWIYYCADCRFFVHLPCVNVSTTPHSWRDEDGFDYYKLMHLPADDEASMCFMMQKCIKDIISVSVDTAMAPPDHINHWAHPDHQLERKNKSDVLAANCDHHHGKYSSQVSSAEILMICDGCTKPISFSSDDADVFYECNQCNYILHRYCAQFPKQIETAYKNFVGRYQRGEFGTDMFQCVSCFTSSNGFSFDIPQMYYSPLDICPLDIWCACLPVVIKHRAHHHPLTQHFTSYMASYPKCAACCLPIRDPVNDTASRGKVLYCCEICNNFFLHVQCVVKEGTVLHRWDPHPLSLVLSLEDDHIENHPHEFECEFCSQEIDTNQWFYHCKVCDLSFHLHNCMDFNNHHYSNVKFGAPNIVRID